MSPMWHCPALSLYLHMAQFLSPTPMMNLLISQPMPMPRHKSSPCMQNIPYCTCTNIVTIPSKILPTIWRFKEGSGPVIARCICNLSPCSPPCLSVSCLPIPLCSVLSGQDVRINVATDSRECASSDQECSAVWVIVICEAAIRDRTHTTAVCNLNGDGWSDSMGSHTWVDIIVSLSAHSFTHFPIIKKRQNLGPKCVKAIA